MAPAVMKAVLAMNATAMIKIMPVSGMINIR
jgi:hypothetical protein